MAPHLLRHIGELPPKEMPNWTPKFVLPNLELSEPIDATFVALSPFKDSRVRAAMLADGKFSDFVGKFKDAFGIAVAPSILLLNEDAPESCRHIDALSGFRDIIALSAIVYSRSVVITDDRSNGAAYGDVFEIYPWEHHGGDYLTCVTPALHGLHSVADFNGQSKPGIPICSLSLPDIDKPILQALIDRWKAWRTDDPQDHSDISLFRSLNMAFHAAKIPAGADVSFYDVGRLIALWVSAFEILVHPGGSGKAGIDDVLNLLERATWGSDGCSKKQFDTRGKPNSQRKPQPIKRTLGSWIYQELYNRRNDFLHGNPVSTDDLHSTASNLNIFEYAAPLYRMALATHLNVSFDRSFPTNLADDLVKPYSDRQAELRMYQWLVEEALQTAAESSNLADED